MYVSVCVRVYVCIYIYFSLFIYIIYIYTDAYRERERGRSVCMHTYVYMYIYIYMCVHIPTWFVCCSVINLLVLTIPKQERNYIGRSRCVLPLRLHSVQQSCDPADGCESLPSKLLERGWGVPYNMYIYICV